jgi:serine protease Do
LAFSRFVNCGKFSFFGTKQAWELSMRYTFEPKLRSGTAGCARALTIPIVALLSFIVSVGSLVAADESTAPTIDLKRIYAGGEPKSIAELRAMEQHQQELAKKLISCTVGIVVGPAHGSGVIVSEDGYVLTAAHVAGMANRQAKFILPDGRRAKGETLGLYRTLDAGLMKITDKGPWPFAEKAEPNGVDVGGWCIATGHPGGFQEGRKPVVRIGRILERDKFAIRTDCTLVGGDSGGPLFDMSGKVIGINSRIGSSLMANMHVPIAAYHESWDRLVKREAWGHLPGTGPYIGVQGDANSDVAKVARVLPKGPAQKAGIKPGDVIVRYGDKQITDFASLQMCVNDSQPGDKITLEVRRGEKIVKRELVVGNRSR